MKNVYQCDHCDFVNELHGVVSQHEIDCTYNPINDSCGTCKFETEVCDAICGWEHSCNAGVWGNELLAVRLDRDPCDKYKAKKNV